MFKLLTTKPPKILNDEMTLRTNNTSLILETFLGWKSGGVHLRMLSETTKIRKLELPKCILLAVKKNQSETKILALNEVNLIWNCIQ